jgi:hypothetical protein
MFRQYGYCVVERTAASQEFAATIRALALADKSSSSEDIAGGVKQHALDGYHFQCGEKRQLDQTWRNIVNHAVEVAKAPSSALQLALQTKV